LDLASQYLMQVQLQGHYRSQSLDLIEFSNQHFYNGKLTLLPDRNILKANKPAIEYIKIDGTWANQTNEAESDKVVEVVGELLKKYPGKGIGIVTFNARQQDLITDKLEVFAAENKITLPEDLFVKNIENVQGDERDVIIFSIGYAPDEKGKINHHFGSLNIVKGENRLNVAVTRARERVIIVTSILPGELRVDDTKNEGPKLLRSYLQYALEVSNGRFIPALKPDNGHSSDWYLKNKIKAMKFEHGVKLEIKEELPFADLTVKQQNQYLGLVLTDDEMYHQSISIKDMHIYTPFTLSAKNWKFVGVLSREYWHDKESVKERLLRFSTLMDD
jgi:hypothetical protein